MKKIKKGSILSLIYYIVSSSIVTIIIWTLLDFLFSKFITGQVFKYSIYDHIISPIIFGIICGILYFLFDLKELKKKNKK